MPVAQVPVVARPKQFGRQYSQLRELSPFPALKRSIFSFVRPQAVDFGLPQQLPVRSEGILPENGPGFAASP